MITNRKKHIFNTYCKKYNSELLYLMEQKRRKQNYNKSLKDKGTLFEIGNNYSAELANYAFKLGYATWLFKAVGTYEEVKESLINTIMENEEKELKNLRKNLEKIEKN